MTTTRATLLMQAAILGVLAALSLRDPATININVTGQSVTVAAPSTTSSTRTAEAAPQGRGWVETLPLWAGTGGGSRAQDTPEIMFSVSNE